MSEDLAQACRANDHARVKCILQSYSDSANGNVNYRLLSCLMVSIELGFTDVVVELLNYESSLVNSTDADLNTPLIKACSSTLCLEMCDELLKRGANPNSTNFFSRNPLDIATTDGNFALAQKLILKGADINIPNLMGYTPIMTALHFDHVDLVKLFIECHANINYVAPGGKTVLHVACEMDSEIRFELFKLLFYNGGEQLLSKFIKPYMKLHNVKPRKTPFLTACENGCLSICRFIVDSVSSEKLLESLNQTEIFFIAVYSSRHVDLLDFVIETFHLSIDERDDGNGYTPLLYYSEKNLINVCLNLIDRGADVTVSDNNGYTPLLLSCKNSNLEYCRFLLSKGVTSKSFTSDPLNLSPLSMSVKNSNPAICDLLLSNGASTMGHETLETTPFYIAVSQYRRDTCNSWIVALIICSVTCDEDVAGSLLCLEHEGIHQDIYSIVRYARASIVSYVFDNLAIKYEFKRLFLHEMQSYVDDDLIKNSREK